MNGETFKGTVELSVERFGTLNATIVPGLGYTLSGVTAANAEGLTVDSKTISIVNAVTDNTITLTFEASARLPGDVNGDGKVDGRDALLLEKYLAGYEVTIIEENANVTGDTRIDGRDALQLEKYLAGYDVVLK